MTELTLDRAWPCIFTPCDAQKVASIQLAPETWAARQPLVHASVPLSSSLYLEHGLLGRYRTDRLGRRQFLSLQIPGDYVDLPAYMLGHLDHNLEAISEAVVRRTPHDAVHTLRQQEPDLFQKLWKISLIDASIDRYWTFRVGRLVGRARVANFFCEMLLRFYARGLCDFDGFRLQVTQVDLAEICGMTPVHVNRLMAELRDEGICTFSQGHLRITNLPDLFQTGQYSWDYLYLDPETDHEIRKRVTATRRGPLHNGPSLLTATKGAGPI